jgi:hypothetical protein
MLVVGRKQAAHERAIAPARVALGEIRGHRRDCSGPGDRIPAQREYDAGVPSRSTVRLPVNVNGPFEVYVNGVLQQEGADYTVDGMELIFARTLAQEGKLGFWRWASMFLGIAGTYRGNDAIDVAYEVRGRKVVATGLPVSPETPTD